MSDEQKQEEVSTDLTPEQEKIAQERAEKGVCVVCGQPRWYCGGEYSHARKKQLGEE